MSKYIVIGTITVIVVLVAGFFLLNKSTSPSLTNLDNQSSQISSSFTDPKKSAHYESNTPAHGSTLSGVPVNVVIDFNFDLAAPSEIKIESNGKDYGVGETEIDTNKLSMRISMDSSAPDGIYTVNYNACWPDGSCHDGYFQFAIDRSLQSNFEDMTGQKEVTIKLSNIMFDPKDIKISKGTKVTWVNDESIEHYVNTDSHPAHTYYLEQNSKALGKGDSYSLTFDTAGIYPYHCSAHADTMIGSILVE